MRVSLFGLLLAVAGLSGCASPYGYNWIPDGYRYQDSTPLSSPAPSSPWFKDAANPNLDHMADNTAAWQGAVYELISPLPQTIQPGTQGIYLSTQPPAYAVDNSFDHYLRQGLISYGYQVNTSGSIKIIYDAAPVSKADIRKLAEQKFGPEFVKKGDMQDLYYLTLQVIGANGRLLADRAIIAVLPYEKEEYWRWSGYASQPVQGWRLNKQPVYETRD